ncbi:30S ribosomal protein S17 [Candidatus Uhrbacteria bacterium RIFCSPLOWO2_01_FULL_47_24]|uniref:Small ribosomal subunit protein uS17 n=1 Tax=Candidatus Uhrbacteria bacterium RIFCSPLOWO2_01_FULL_47_24 TaxID=1802401 RepID=A0A1F7UTM9_9BACT|nr:MAG: 30S ribosomal protein S17 [Candidatus Uhrbacteria bacterium RIFCSPHIGHO2_01_FULL_47_11]OGL68971.1 MAG: 30S ribosomal protein S17 [Candidatus Uhrbacteria bacterium RIFCSPHIGHO2_02_FULL_46_47]OGL74912.1 MAG: 30S ribosomal protein S17 [Candidatus Uhrbacteria bacterium RIFCSPHIGHO2_12_FULL_47_11]OGL81652.1 MAG: 30S ribosomal protein S17 [Candidatus Uhrbacteria bacterium RIFCSPLOWO2_01_FULL_47_24]OGL85095.1 MAG: 30S ribosomal protein S17 [Candidatus Uhrbacteria bacterium RIFCSPLOWO2_02_FULL_
MSHQESSRRRLQGIIISDKMAKTVVVRVDRMKMHPKYKKRYTMSKKYKAHDEKGDYHVGDQVIIEETRPISKDKCWRVVKKI